MNNQLFLILFWILVSCGTPVSSLYQDKMVSVISAEKTEWTGGRSGVKGIMYTITLKQKTNNSITVKKLMAEGNNIPFAQTTSGNTITIRGNFQYKNKEENEFADQTSPGNTKPQNLNPKNNWIEYTIKGSTTSSRLNISKFISVESSEEPAP